MRAIMPIVAHHQRPGADRGPYIGVRALLADAGFILKPNLYWPAGGRAEQDFLQQGTEVFLKASSTAASFFACTGRGCTRVRRSRRSHLSMVRSATVTPKRRVTSSRRHPSTSSRGNRVRLGNSTIIASSAGVRTVLCGALGPVGASWVCCPRPPFGDGCAAQAVTPGQGAARVFRRLELGSNSRRCSG